MGNSDNPRVGADFEVAVRSFFAGQGLVLRPKFEVPVGVAGAKKPHKFDLGGDAPPVLVECKCHVWTSGGNSPSAKLTVWNEAVLYFACAPPHYRKILAVLRSLRGAEALADHYLKRYGHLVPAGVELWEIDTATGTGRQLR